jgi:phage anti-repressor protein
MSLVSAYDKNLFSTTVGGWTTSVDATIRTVGSLNVDFDVDVSWLKLKSAAMTINPEGVAASMQLALTEKGTLSKAYNWQQTVLSIPIQGITIAKVVKLGAFLDIDVGFTMEEWTGEAHANLGARMEISDSAIVKVDLVNSKNNAFSGWTPSFTPIPLTLSAKVAGSAKAYAEPNVKLEASALGKGWNVGLNMQMPYISADFAAMYDSTGVCDSKKTLGVDIDARIGVELTVQAATKGNEANPFWEQELYSKDWPLFSKCMAFGPNNAKTGEVVEPNPASKTKKSSSKAKSSSKKSSKPPSKTPTPTPTPSKKSSSSKKASSTPKSTPPPSSKKSKSDEPEPTGKSSSKKASSKSEDEASITGTSKTPKSSGTEEPSRSKSSKSSSSDESGSTSKTSSHSTFSTTSWSNSTRTSHHDGGPEPTDDPSASKSASSGSASSGSASSGSASVTPSATGDEAEPTGGDESEPTDGDESEPTGGDEAGPTGGDEGEQPPVSSSGSKSHSGPGSPSETGSRSGITPPPSTLSTVTSTVSSSSSKSSDDSCPITGCETCKDSLDMDSLSREHYEIEVEAMPDPTDNLTARALQHRGLQKREASREYTYICSTVVTEVIRMAKYPTFTDYTRANFPCSVDRFYEGEKTADCLNHKISFATTPPAPIGTPYFAMEHIYEGNWIVNFLRELVDNESVACDEIQNIFFEPNRGGSGDKWIKEIMASLGSTQNQDLLVFLRQNLNSAKYRIFMDGNDIIGDDTWRTAVENKNMLEKIATVGRAMDYLEKDDVGERLKKTVIKIEETLNKLVDAAESNEDLKKALGKYAKKGLLADKHRDWLSKFMASRNAHAQTQISKWASTASTLIFTGTATPTSGKPLETWKSLSKWQHNPADGFNASKWL